MKLEQIDTSTTAGKAEVMRLAAEGRKVAAKSRSVTGDFQVAHGPVWDWSGGEYAIISVPVGPDEVWIVVGADIELFSEAGAKVCAEEIGGTVVRYRRVEE